MFAASKIRRAVDLKASFLQCDMYFHTISLSELQSEFCKLSSNLLQCPNLVQCLPCVVAVQMYLKLVGFICQSQNAEKFSSNLPSSSSSSSSLLIVMRHTHIRNNSRYNVSMQYG